jgi:transmembrane sensor
MHDWDLIAKFVSGETTATENQAIEAWLQERPGNQKILNDLRKAMRPIIDKSPDFTTTMSEDWMQLQTKLHPDKKSVQLDIGSRAQWWYKVAASILLVAVAGAGLWFLINRNFSAAEQSLFATTDSVSEISLSDESRIWLNRFSELTVDESFLLHDRKVKLEGEAYFEVAKDASKPFVISTGVIETKVIGTTFNVDFQEDGSVTVTVIEGKVSVSMKKGESVFLVSGETGSYDAETFLLKKDRTRDLNFLSWKTGVIRFEDESLKNVSAFLSSHYNVVIELENPTLEQHAITTTLDNVPLEEALSIIGMTLDLSVEPKDSKHYLVKQK